MITNEVLCRATKAHLATFEAAETNLAAKCEGVTDSKLALLELAAVRAQAEDLRAEIAEYELRSGAHPPLRPAHLPSYPPCSSKRGSLGAGPSATSRTLSVSPSSRCKRYEARGYRAASLARLCDIADTLNVIVTERAVLGGPTAA